MPQSQGRRTADIAVTILLLVVHGVLAVTTVGLLGLLVMGTDSCAYQNCGDPAWLDRAMWLGILGGGAVGVADLLISAYRLSRQKLAFFVPVIGCLAQVGLAIGAAAMESLAGPV
jgi:hypothetical protein